MTVWGPLTGVLIGVVALFAATLNKPVTQLIFNPTDSAPKGWYFVRPSVKIHVGDYVVAQIPREAALLAATRDYLPLTLPILKQVGAVGGQRVCGRNGSVYFDQIAVARVRTIDGRGRALTPWQHCRDLEKDELFLLNRSHAASFDSRYFGPIRITSVRGRATPLWTWSST